MTSSATSSDDLSYVNDGSYGATRDDSVAAGARESGVRRAWVRVRRVPVLLLVAVLKLYQLVISPMEGPTCRYYPSCSQYAVIAVQRHGALRGGWLAVRRLGRCHPWTSGGVDDVPPVRPHTRAGDVGRTHTSEELR